MMPSLTNVVQGQAQKASVMLGGRQSQDAPQHDELHTKASSNHAIEQLQMLADQFNRSRLVTDAKLLGQIPNLAFSALHGTGMDDRKMQLEQLITLLADLPVSSNVSRTLSNTLISIVCGDIQRPPGTYMGKGHKYRTPDGSGNSIDNPSLGASEQPYSRNVTPIRPKPINLPDPGTVFDLLLARKENKPHPSEISSLLFNFANIVIHDIFATSREPGLESSINHHSSYLDLQVVYGANKTEQDKVRTKTLGQLKSDAVGDWRMAIMPPSTAVLAVLFSRNHNYIAKRVYEVNEGKRFDGLKEADIDQQLFDIARLVNCGMFLHIILQDYIPTILNTNDSEWFVNPVEIIANIGGPGKLARGNGNSVSAEFSLLYRWHAAVSEADEKWMNEFFESKWPGKRPDEITPQQFVMTAAGVKQSFDGIDPGQWNLHDWKRDAQGKFDDATLAKVLKDATNEVAAAFRARGHPKWFRPVEILGMITARKDWALCTMNEFRNFLGLKTYSSFAEWNKDPEIHKAAEMLYGDIDNLELYPGMMAEDPKPSIPGSGLCPGYTISRGILSDAAALTRGDRFYTTDYSTSNMTSFGYTYSKGTQAGSRGILGKMIMSTLPGQFPYNSIYALYPFRIPSRTIRVLTERGILHQYDTKYPEGLRQWHEIESYSATREILEDPRFFTTRPAVSFDQDAMVSALLAIPKWQSQVSDFYRTNTARLMREKSICFSASDNTRLVDLLDVVNTVSAEFTATLFALPTPGAHGFSVGVSSKELHSLLADSLGFAMYGSFDFLGRQTWQLQEDADVANRKLRNLLWARMHTIGGMLSPMLNLMQGISNVLGGPSNLAANPMAKQFYEHLFATGKTNDQLVNDCLQMMVSLTATQSLIMLHIAEYLLDEKNAEHLSAVHSLCQKSDPASMIELRARLLEAHRLTSSTPSHARFAVQDVTLTDAKGEKVTVRSNEGVFISPSALYRDPELHQQPDRFQTNRSAVRLGLGDVPTQLLLEVALPAMAQQIFRHSGLKMGSAGPPPVVTDPTPAAKDRLAFFVGNKGAEHPLPIDTSMHILFKSSSNGKSA